MKIVETMQLEEVELNMLQRAWRWVGIREQLYLSPGLLAKVKETIGKKADDPDALRKAELEEIRRNFNRLRDGNSLTRSHLVMGRESFHQLLAEIRIRIQQFSAGIDTSTALEVQKNGGTPLLDPSKAAELAAGMVQNYKAGEQEVEQVVKMLTTGINALKEPPELDEESDEYLSREIDAVVVHR